MIDQSVRNPVIHVASLSLENIAYAAYSFQPGHGSRPLSMLSFAFDYWRSGGLDPEAFKSTNLLIHALTAFVLALLLRNLLLLARWSDQHAALAALVMSGSGRYIRFRCLQCCMWSSGCKC